MPGTKKTSMYRRSRKGRFFGKRKHEEMAETAAVGTPTVVRPLSLTICSPPKKNRSEEKINRNCPIVQKEESHILTRKRAFDLGMMSSNKVIQSHGNHIIDSHKLQQALTTAAICSICRNANGKLQLRQDNSRRKGLHEFFLLKCTNCKHEVSFESGNKSGIKRGGGSAEVNLRMVQGGLMTGNGLASLQKICSIMNLPSPVTSRAYNESLKEIESITKEVGDLSLQMAAKNLKKFVVETDHNFANADIEKDEFSVAVSVDGTWQKRYGYSSLHGVIFVIAMDTGEVLDYEVKSKVCFECRHRSLWDRNSERYKNWFAIHKASCSINHSLSSEAMEKEAAVTIFKRSLSKHNLKYTTYVGDGDSSSFGEVSDTLFQEYGEEYLIIKEDCVGHIQKRMGTGLRSYKNKNKGMKLADGGSVGGRGRLTDSVIDSFQNYYGYAIRNNNNNVKGMQDAVWAIFHHCILGENEPVERQHRLCPPGPDSWCKYQQDIAANTNTYSRSKCLPSVFRDELKHIFERLSDLNLLQRCQQGFTQNQNEAINNILWAKCPKRVFVGSSKIETAAASSVLTWNQGAGSMGLILERAGIDDLGSNTMAGFREENKTRVQNMAYKVLSKYRRRRRQLRHMRKQKASTGTHYLPGGFGTGKEPEVEKKGANRNRGRNFGKKKKSSCDETIRGDKELENLDIDIQFVDENQIQVCVQGTRIDS